MGFRKKLGSVVVGDGMEGDRGEEFLASRASMYHYIHDEGGYHLVSLRNALYA